MTHTQTQTILLVDDEPSILKATRLMLLGNGFTNVLAVSNSSEVMTLLEKEPVAVVVLDLTMPGVSGQELLSQIVASQTGISVIVMTALDETATAVECMKNGAFDYLIKPVESARLLATVRKALEVYSLSRELRSLKRYLLTDQLSHPEAFKSIITNDKKMRSLFQYVEVISSSRQPVLICGETGVGKELMARAVHEVCCKKGDFIAVNVAGLDDVMFSDVLFGHKKGAFTGADQAREGLISKAAQGTLFLDEIGDLAESSQIKLLRLLQENEYYPVGSDSPKRCEARIVVATNRPLKELMLAGNFRKDLYYRLATHQIEIPPLRERKDDILPILENCVEKAAASMGKTPPEISQEVIDILYLLDFPGNVRELEGLAFDAVARSVDGILPWEVFASNLGEYDLPPNFVNSDKVDDGGGIEQLKNIFGHFPTLCEVERWMISGAIRETGGHQGNAANLLGITRQTLNKRVGEMKRESCCN